MPRCLPPRTTIAPCLRLDQEGKRNENLRMKHHLVSVYSVFIYEGPAYGQELLLGIALEIMTAR